MDLWNFISFLGLIFFIAFGWLISADRKRINWQAVIWGVGLQMLFALFVFIVPAGVKVFLLVNDAVVKVMECASAGARFLFGPLALSPGMSSQGETSSLGFILAFQAFPTIIFFSALISILYYVNIIPRIIRGFAYVFTRLMKVSGAESMCTASNIFVGVESVFVIRPFLKDMTKSELCTVLTAGMATVSSNVLAIYIFSLKEVFPTIAGHLISASILSAPAALAMSKILLPESGVPATLGEDIRPFYEKDGSLFEAVIKGAEAGLKLIGGIAALLIAVLGLVALFDFFLQGAGNQINSIFHLSWEWSLKNILGIIFYPFTVILGIPPSDSFYISRIIGERAVATEVIAYQDLAKVMADNLLSSPRSAVIAAYALCGFAHAASIAVFIGGISALVPEKTKTLAQIGFRSFLAATLACLMTACIAGIFYTRNSLLLGF